MKSFHARYQLVITLIMISPLARAYMPPYDSYFKEKQQNSGSEELSATTVDSLPHSHQKLKHELSDCLSTVAALENSMKSGIDASSVNSGDSIAVSAEHRNAATELIHLQRLYSETQTLLESANAKLLESQTEMESLREALGKSHEQLTQMEQARAEAEANLALLERQLAKERESSNKFVEESRRGVEAEFGRRFRWQEQRNLDLVSTNAYLEQQISEKDSQCEEAKAELLTTRYELYNANERLRGLEHNRYKEILRISFARIVDFLVEIKDLARESLPMDQMQSTLELVKAELSPVWHALVASIKTTMGIILPPDIIYYQDQVISNTCELFELFFIFVKLQAAPASTFSILQVFQANCTEAVIWMELAVTVMGFVFIVQSMKHLFRFRKPITINKSC